jgi:hypothetical protein
VQLEPHRKQQLEAWQPRWEDAKALPTAEPPSAEAVLLEPRLRDVEPLQAGRPFV